MNASPEDPHGLLGQLWLPVAQRLAQLEEPSSAELDVAWAQSGAMPLIGWPKRPLWPPRDLLAALVRLGGWIRMLGGVDVDPLRLLAERATLNGFIRGGTVSCGGSSRLLRCADGWLAVTLARPADFSALPAWLGVSPEDPCWTGVTQAVGNRAASDLAASGRLLDLPVAPLASVHRKDGPAVSVRAVGRKPMRAEGIKGALAVDLSSLWAGPLCARLLQGAGARVVKVESLTRPDGARMMPRFFDLLHADQESVLLDFDSEHDRARLRQLLTAADIVIESSRPRALRQLGIGPDDLLRHGSPRLWISITGYGYEGEAGNWVAFGDDAAVAGGLVAWDRGEPCFCADAVADPASGLVAAAAAFAAPPDVSWKLDVALTRVAAALAPPRGYGWSTAPIANASPARAPDSRGVAPTLGQDTARVLETLDQDPSDAAGPGALQSRLA